MEAYEIAEVYQELWQAAPKGVVITEEVGRFTVICFYTQVEHLWLHAALEVGPQGGINEIVVALDPNQPIMADRLVAYSSSYDAHRRDVFVDLLGMRRAAGSAKRTERKTVATQQGREAMSQALSTLNEGQYPASYFDSLPVNTVYSVRHVSGGLPGHGRRGGGARGARG